MDALVEAVRALDPDIILGWEVQQSGLGYLIDRAAQIERPLCQQLSRTPSVSGSSCRTHWGRCPLFRLHCSVLIGWHGEGQCSVDAGWSLGWWRPCTAASQPSRWGLIVLAQPGSDCPAWAASWPILFISPCNCTADCVGQLSQLLSCVQIDLPLEAAPLQAGSPSRSASQPVPRMWASFVCPWGPVTRVWPWRPDCMPLKTRMCALEDQNVHPCRRAAPPDLHLSQCHACEPALTLKTIICAREDLWQWPAGQQPQGPHPGRVRAASRLGHPLLRAHRDQPVAHAAGGAQAQHLHLRVLRGGPAGPPHPPPTPPDPARVVDLPTGAQWALNDPVTGVHKQLRVWDLGCAVIPE